MTSTPDEARPAGIEETADDGGVSTGAAEDEVVRDAEEHAEHPLELDEEELRGDAPPEP